MHTILDFFRQKVPGMGKETPQYYRQAIQTTGVMLVVYYLLSFFFFRLANHHWEWVPLLMILWAGAGIWSLKKLNLRTNLILFTIHCFFWVGWVVRSFGWSIGVQHLLTLLLVFVFFNVYEKAVWKIIWFLIILAFRILLFSWAQQNPALYTLTAGYSTALQTINTVTFFLIMAGICIIFSTSIQDTERQLRIRNQTLYKEAGTDQLTGLPNRRAMIERIERFLQESPDPTFCIAIADIDWFKKVNDTYGHNCGDYTLVKLTELFTQHSAGRYSVCRWGGEEFCFFLPGMNLDEAGSAMRELAFAVEKMELKYEEAVFSITITIGVEENDFSSPLEDLLNSADKKLYIGKESGRNRVVV